MLVLKHSYTLVCVRLVIYIFYGDTVLNLAQAKIMQTNCFLSHTLWKNMVTLFIGGADGTADIPAVLVNAWWRLTAVSGMTMNAQFMI